MKMNFLWVGAILLLISGAARAQTLIPVADSDFQSPTLGPSSFVIAPGGTGWTFSPAFGPSDSAPDGSGIASNGGQNLNNADGGQAAYLQDASYISQVVTIDSSSYITLQLDVEGRESQHYVSEAAGPVDTVQNELKITFGNQVLMYVLPTNTDGFITITTPTIGVGPGSYLVKIAGITSRVTTGHFTDAMSFVDNVEVQSLTAPEPSATMLLLLGGVALAGVTLRRKFLRRA